MGGRNPARTGIQSEKQVLRELNRHAAPQGQAEGAEGVPRAREAGEGKGESAGKVLQGTPTHPGWVSVLQIQPDRCVRVSPLLRTHRRDLGEKSHHSLSSPAIDKVTGQLGRGRDTAGYPPGTCSSPPWDEKLPQLTQALPRTGAPCAVKDVILARLGSTRALAPVLETIGVWMGRTRPRPRAW